MRVQRTRRPNRRRKGKSLMERGTGWAETAAVDEGSCWVEANLLGSSELSIGSGGRNAGGTNAAAGGATPAGTITPRTTPAMTEPPPTLGTTTPLYGGGGGTGPVIPDSPISNASQSTLRCIIEAIEIVSDVYSP
ncbi:P-loop containing nucleoside triphosphatehydrolases superfamily protein [Striga asiatica]|uniref:P-loop containing nucleoside triphosphatehydrolases superfamily protein n=1 Tax=Striga asiatica TaxID=4170 RepID=A0A5A7Q8M0_STRAF|nr:P-loop containing nucleoside triphosphatehydrolases superfamily protein [Striga asiatica]